LLLGRKLKSSRIITKQSFSVLAVKWQTPLLVLCVSAPPGLLW
jgi:hypothetical protein